MSPFRNLRESLLRAGIAPRHVRAYLAELTEHLDDLIQRELAVGYHDEEAVLRARAKLGDDATLAAAMLEQPGTRSISARVPWLVFAALPPVVLVIAAIVCQFAIFIIGGTQNALGTNLLAPVPEWFKNLAVAGTMAGNVLVMPLIATLFVMLARRQRIRPIWPVAGIVILVLLFITMTVDFQSTHSYGGVFSLRYRYQDTRLGISAAPLFTATGWSAIASQWPVVMAQWALTALPMLWLLKMSRANSKTM